MPLKSNNSILAAGPQPTQPEESPGALGGVALGAIGLGATGFVPVGQRRLWDYYLSGIRGVESGFPAAILRTFRVSEALSPFETWSRFDLSQKTLKSRSVYGQYLRQMLGEETLSATVFRRKGVFGEIVNREGRAVGLAASIASGTQRGETIADYYARLAGVPIDEALSLKEGALRARWETEGAGLPYKEWLKELSFSERQPRVPLIAPYRKELEAFGKKIKLGPTAQRAVARAEIAQRFVRAKAATTIGRLNTLLRKPFEIAGIGGVLRKIPLISGIGIKPGSAATMMGGYIKKGMVAGGVLTALSYYDYLRSQGGLASLAAGPALGGALGGLLAKRHGRPFSTRGAVAGAAVGLLTAISPRFDEGLFHGALSLVTDLNVARAEFSQKLGLQKAVRRQEEITPGLLSAKTAIGFAGVGALGAGLAGYGKLLHAATKEKMATRKPFEEIFSRLRSDWYGEGDEVGRAGKWIQQKIGRRLKGIPLIGKPLSKIKSPMAMGAIGGTALWLGASTLLPLLSGNIGAAIPGVNLLATEETPEELRAIYSGEKEVPVRKGRFWEMGRCLSADDLVLTNSEGYKRAADIVSSDRLMASDGRYRKITGIWQRPHCGKMYHFYSVMDKNIPVSVTGNHKVPVATIEKGNLREKEIDACEINTGDYLRVAVPDLEEDLLKLDTEDLLKTGCFFVDKNFIYPAQRNWCHGRTQRSRGPGIPKEFGLSPNLGRLFGYFLAEGNLSYNKCGLPYMIELVFARDEQWIIDDISSICEKEFSIRPTVHLKTTGEKAKEGCWVVRVCSSLLSRVLFELFYAGDKEQDKQFPRCFLKTSAEFKEALVEGYWRGDGHVDGKARIISSSRFDYVLQTQKILLSLGYYPTVGGFEENGFKGKYRLRWRPDKAFKGKGFSGRFKKVEDRLYARIEQREISEYDGMVYDFGIDHADHLFATAFVFVHNSTPYEGGRVEYYRPHALERLRTRAYQKGVWGDEEEKWAHSPLLHPLKAIFGSDEWKYHYETKHQYDRPAPLTGTYGENVPFVGPLVAATVGKLLKPRKYVRPEEWMGEGGYTYLPGEEEPAYELGGLPPGAPVAPEEASQLFNELMYRRREAVGLVGFAEGAIQEAATGREEYFPNLTTMATMGEETSSEYWLWDHLNLGGAAGTSEVVRRFIPHERRYLEKYNPLARQAPSWMPEDYFRDLVHGNPFEEIPEAELRLPGAGYAALYPEVEGLSPEEYPLAHRLKILGDVAHWSSEYRGAAKTARKRMGGMSPEHQRLVEQTLKQVKEKKRRRTFDEYRFRDEELSEMMLTIRDVLSPRDVVTEELGPMKVSLQGVGAARGNVDEALAAAREALVGRQVSVMTPSLEGRRYDVVRSGPRMKGVAMLGETPYGAWMAEQGYTEPSPLEDEFEQLQYGVTERMAGGIWEKLSRAVETPFEALTPLSPASKLIRKRSAIEEYAKTEAIGTEASFWNKPLKNFLLPAMEEMEYALGDEEVPGPTKQRRTVEEYFDMLEWEKQRRLAATAETSQDRARALALQRRTMFGMDPFGSPGKVMGALPRATRDFFQAFSEAQTLEDRERILSLVSQQERRAYLAQWMRQQQIALEAKKRVRVATRQDAISLNKILMARRSEGYGYTPSDLEQWESETGRRISFDDWLREKKAQEYWDTHSLPGADWIGFHPSVDLEDVQARWLQEEGLDHHDFDIWGDKMRSLARKPYISQEVTGQLESREGLSQEDAMRPALMKRNLRTLQDSLGAEDARIEVSNIGAPGVSRYNINVRDERASLIEKTMKELDL